MYRVIRTCDSMAHMKQLENYINGAFSPSVTGQYLDNFDPSTGAAYSRVPDSSAADVDAAVTAAQNAFPAWSSLPGEERARLVRKLGELITENADALAKAESIDNGKPLTLARTVDMPRAARNFTFFADTVSQYATTAFPTGSSHLNYVLRAPLGVVACISPWNLPLYLLTWKIAPALATGNCVVAKPSEVTPMTAYLFSQLCTKAGLPPGVLNIVHGTGLGVGKRLVSHPLVKAVSFTGSTKTGEEIARVAGGAFKKVSLEMGGKNPTIVFADCDFERTVNETVRAAYSNQGQICLCGSRIYVEQSIYAKFRDAVVAKIKTLKIGDPLMEGTDVGAIVSKLHFDKINAAIATAQREGGKILVGGKTRQLDGRCSGGWFIEPTLIGGLPQKCETNQEEIFGPVATIMPFSNEAEAIALANDVKYGLAASVWSQDISRAHRVAAQIEAGIVWVNCWMIRDLRTPFGGVKDSGVGREGGEDVLHFFTETKNVCVYIDETKGN